MYCGSLFVSFKTETPLIALAERNVWDDDVVVPNGDVNVMTKRTFGSVPQSQFGRITTRMSSFAAAGPIDGLWTIN